MITREAAESWKLVLKQSVERNDVTMNGALVLDIIEALEAKRDEAFESLVRDYDSLRKQHLDILQYCSSTRFRLGYWLEQSEYRNFEEFEPDEQTSTWAVRLFERRVLIAEGEGTNLVEATHAALVKVGLPDFASCRIV